MAQEIRVLEKHEKETFEGWTRAVQKAREAREEGTAFATIYKNTELIAWKAWKEAETDLKWEEFRIAAAKALKPDEEIETWEEMEKAAVEWKAAKELKFPSEIETWEAREEAFEALKAEQIDAAWNEFCTNYDLSPLCY